jgi:hypothetical protein
MDNTYMIKAPARLRRYTETIVISVTEEMKARLVDDAQRHGLSLAEAARTYIEAGIEAGEREASKNV